MRVTSIFLCPTSSHTDSGGVSRFFYCAKASKSERNAGCEGLEEKTKEFMGEGIKNLEGNDPVTARFRTAMKNHHPTVKPLALMEYLCKLTKTPTGGIVLDPFAGSGTTAVACIKTNRPFICCDLSKDYCEIARKRVVYEMLY